MIRLPADSPPVRRAPGWARSGPGLRRGATALRIPWGAPAQRGSVELKDDLVVLHLRAQALGAQRGIAVEQGLGRRARPLAQPLIQ